MRTFSAPAAYRRHLEATFAIALDEVGRDVKFLDDDDERVRALAPVDPALRDDDAPGRVVVAVLTEAEAAALNLPAARVA